MKQSHYALGQAAAIALTIGFGNACARPATTAAGSADNQPSMTLAASSASGPASNAAPAADARPPHFLLDRRPQTSQRIVSLAPSMTEILFALDAGERVIGVTRFCDYPAAAKQRTKIGGFLDPSLEAIAGLKPDLVVTVPNGSNRQVVERLSDLGIPVLLVYDYDLADLDRAIPAIGDAIGQRDQAQALLQHMHADSAAVRAAVAGQDRPTVLFLYGRQPMVAAGPGSYADALIEIAGGRNALGSAFPRYATISLENVVVLAPDVVIDAYTAGHGAAPTPLDLERLANLPAVKQRQVYHLTDNAALRPGPRVGTDARIVAALLHPGLAL